jgi:hypothetical protein
MILATHLKGEKTKQRLIPTSICYDSWDKQAFQEAQRKEVDSKNGQDMYLNKRLKWKYKQECKKSFQGSRLYLPSSNKWGKVVSVLAKNKQSWAPKTSVPIEYGIPSVSSRLRITTKKKDKRYFLQRKSGITHSMGVMEWQSRINWEKRENV